MDFFKLYHTYISLFDSYNFDYSPQNIQDDFGMRAYDLFCAKRIKLYYFDWMQGCENHPRLVKHNLRDAKAKESNLDE